MRNLFENGLSTIADAFGRHNPRKHPRELWLCYLASVKALLKMRRAGQLKTVSGRCAVARDEDGNVIQLGSAAAKGVDRIEDHFLEFFNVRVVLSSEKFA